MSLLVSCRWAAPKYCANMWWLCLICVLNLNTFETFASNSSDPVYDTVCATKEYRCANGVCILVSRVCDGENDCGDNSDENTERCKENRTCTSSEYTCKTGRCIPASWRCDSEKDCSDGSDEDPSICSDVKDVAVNQLLRPSTSPRQEVSAIFASNSSGPVYDTECPIGQSRCANGICIPIYWMCDGENDCGDNSDENTERCKENRTCTSSEHRCKTGRCIPASWRCDNEKDCSDGSDEDLSICSDVKDVASEQLSRPSTSPRQEVSALFASNSSGSVNDTVCATKEYRCANGVCTLISRVCDGENDCGDNSDENTERCKENRTCTSSEYRCKTGRCIPASWRCDSEKDCSDGSDEDPSICSDVKDVASEQLSRPSTSPRQEVSALFASNSSGPVYDTECPIGQSRCANGICIPIYWMCDGENDCGDNSDENTESCKENRTCSSSDYRCKTGRCIPASWRCDNEKDCSDGSDEDLSICSEVKDVASEQLSHPSTSPRQEVSALFASNSIDPVYHIVCATKHYRCPNGTCIPINWVCDGENDCGDNSDENTESCEKNDTCTSSEYRCKTGWCIPASWRCDTEKDCSDGSDEDPSICSDVKDVASEQLSRPSTSPRQEVSALFASNSSGHVYDTECPIGQSRCANGICIPIYWMCDGENDCGDNSDENTESCKENRTCSSSDYRCKTGRCIPASWRCDNEKDCSDGSDEDLSICSEVKDVASEQLSHPSTSPRQEVSALFASNSIDPVCHIVCATKHYRCPNGTCIPINWVCDGENDCGDNSDENTESCEKNDTCTSSEYRCKTGWCIPASWRCDTEKDCSDGSDEDPSICSDVKDVESEQLSRPSTSPRQEVSALFASNSSGPVYDTECPIGQSRCANGICIPIYWMCDGENDCGDNSDENTESCKENRTCSSSDYRCKTGRCIPASWRCDNEKDCSDGSDEDLSICSEVKDVASEQLSHPSTSPRQEVSALFASNSIDPVYHIVCATKHYRCPNGTCIPINWVCDGENDCGDNSDENTESCEKNGTCISSEYRCKTGRCIPASWRCDNEKDCSDGSDEDPSICSDVKDVASEQLSRPSTSPRQEVSVLFASNSSGSVNDTVCATNEYQCANGVCTLISWVCDGENDCGDNSDENTEMCKKNRKCTSSEYRCKTGRCIPAAWRCDSEKDCSDGSDEDPSICSDVKDVASEQLSRPSTSPRQEVSALFASNSSGPVYDTVCSIGQSRCANGICIPIYWVCDGENDCGDNSDENTEMCKKNRTCTSSEYRCKTGRCIPASWRCDSEKDCSDGSDEDPSICSDVKDVASEQLSRPSVGPWQVSALWRETVRSRLQYLYYEGRKSQYFNRYPILKSSDGWRLLRRVMHGFWTRRKG